MVKNVLIDTINIKKFLVLNPDDGHVNLIPPRKNFMQQIAGPIKKIIWITTYIPFLAN
tara:strand:+ start:20642 stop:20815 length:174 start_codon:yes stop_codon:yes gene_type:complete